MVGNYANVDGLNLKGTLSEYGEVHIFQSQIVVYSVTRKQGLSSTSSSRKYRKNHSSDNFSRINLTLLVKSVRFTL